MSDVERVKELADDLATLSTKIADKHLYDREQKILRELADLALKLAQRVEEMEKNYYELLYAVASKFPDETRHETALRYIINAEKSDKGPCMTQPPKDTP